MNLRSVYDETDELGFNIVRHQVYIHDLQATILHMLGFDHTKLTRQFPGHDSRLADVRRRVGRVILA